MPPSSAADYNRPPFPTYLLPSISFQRRGSASSKRRRQSSTTSTSTYATSPSSSDGERRDSAWSPITTPSSSPPGNHYLPPHTRGPSISSLTAAMTSSLFRKDDSTANTYDEEPKEVSLIRQAPDTLKCANCATDLAFSSQIVSKGFTGRHGRAYLVGPPPTTPPSTTSYLHRLAHLKSSRNSSSSSGQDSRKLSKSDKIVDTAGDGNLINIKVGRSVSRQLVTGQHIVADITCAVCVTVVGWKYVDASEKAQMYKVGKFILETKRVIRGVGWEDAGIGQSPADNEEDPDDDLVGIDKDGEIEFDSEDDEECDELFAGVWDAETVRKRRGKKVAARRR